MQWTETEREKGQDGEVPQSVTPMTLTAAGGAIGATQPRLGKGWCPPVSESRDGSLLLYSTGFHLWCVSEIAHAKKAHPYAWDFLLPSPLSLNQLSRVTSTNR